jgi:hypothetical protein
MQGASNGLGGYHCWRFSRVICFIITQKLSETELSSHTRARMNKAFRRRWKRLCTIISCKDWVYGGTGFRLGRWCWYTFLYYSTLHLVFELDQKLAAVKHGCLLARWNCNLYIFLMLR